MFVLSSIVRKRIEEKKPTFCCFVDFAKAFDSLDTELLIKALKCIGIEGNMLGLIKSLYTGTMSAVKVNDLVSDWFPTEAGVRQGQNDSPTLFLAYIDSLAKAIKISILELAMVKSRCHY